MRLDMGVPLSAPEHEQFPQLIFVRAWLTVGFEYWLSRTARLALIAVLPRFVRVDLLEHALEQVG